PFRVTVSQPNRPPVITSTPPTPALFATATAVPYQYRVRAQDPDGDGLRYSLSAPPAGMSIDPQSGVLTWANPGPVGSVTVTVVVPEDRSPTPNSPSQTFPLPVVAAPANRPPQFVSRPPTTVGAGRRYVYRPEALDPDNEPVTFGADTLPGWLTFSNGELSG